MSTLLLVLGLVLVVGLGTLDAQPEQMQISPLSFDFDKDNALYLSSGIMGQAIRASVSPTSSDASLVFRISALNSNALYDALAPYHPTALGVYSNIPKQPPHQVTTRNKNTAMLYCSARVLANAIPEQALNFGKMLNDLGLDPADFHESGSDPVGIGNLCARSINQNRDKDRMNSKGDIGSSKYGQKPFSDYTGYKPVNTPDTIVDPSRWQPAVTNKAGIVSIQSFVTPQHGLTKAYAFDDVTQFRAKPHGRLLVGPKGYELYKNTTDEVIKVSAQLTEEQKLLAEFFNDKLLAFGYAMFGVLTARNVTFDDAIFLEFLTNVATFDTSIAVWSEKRRFDSVRPHTAIKYLYGDNLITAYGGPGKGTVNDLPASDWRSYISVADHPEYPSLTAAVCAAFAETVRLFQNDDRSFLQPVPFTKGFSQREIGLTPANNISVSFDTWTQFEKACGVSRVWGGVHFVDAVEEGSRMGNQVGKMAFEYVMRLVNGSGSPALAKTAATNAGAKATFASVPRGVVAPKLVPAAVPRNFVLSPYGSLRKGILYSHPW